VSRTDLFLMLAIVMVVTALFCTHLGLDLVSGAPVSSITEMPEFAVSSNSTGFDGFLDNCGVGIINVFLAIGWLLSLVLVIMAIATFQVVGVPDFIAIIYGVMGLASVWLLVGVIRGNH
jgi:hypothetical protein